MGSAPARAAACMVLGVALGLSACSPASWMPRVEGGLEAANAPDSCGIALAAAEDARDGADAPASRLTAHGEAGRIGPANLTRWQRLALASSARTLWRTVAVSCPGRFAEGVLTAAQMDRRAAALADAVHASYASLDAHRTVIDESTRLVVSSVVAGRMATAQDRAGFSYEVLASRHRADSTRLMAMADRHRALATGFAARTKDDAARQKVYAVDRLLASPNAVADDATGLTAPTVAVVAMDLVREQLAALTDGDGSDATVITDEGTADLLASLLAEEASQALELGFPAYDAALFTKA